MHLESLLYVQENAFDLYSLYSSIFFQQISATAETLSSIASDDSLWVEQNIVETITQNCYVGIDSLSVQKNNEMKMHCLLLLALLIDFSLNFVLVLLHPYTHSVATITESLSVQNKYLTMLQWTKHSFNF